MQGCKSRGDTSPNNFDFCLVCPEIFPPCCNEKYIGGVRCKTGKISQRLWNFNKKRDKNGWRAKKGHQKILEEMSRKTWVFLLPRSLKIIPPKYADHPPNAGHGFAALFSCKDYIIHITYDITTQFFHLIIHSFDWLLKLFK